MTKKPKHGTLSTIGKADKNTRATTKETDVVGKMKRLLGLNKIRFHSHANSRMAQRNVIYFEVLQALAKGKPDPKKDRFSTEHQSWEYSIEGKTMDSRLLRIGISFEVDQSSAERLLVVTVIEPGR